NHFLFYLPSRYPRVVIPFLLLVFVVWNASQSIQHGLRLLQRGSAFVWIIGVVELIIIAILIFYPSEAAQVGTFNMKWILAASGLLFGMLGVSNLRRKPRRIKPIQLTSTPLGRILIGISLMLFLMGWGAYARIFTEVHYLNPTQSERQLLTFIAAHPADIWIAGTPQSLDSIELLAQRQVLFSYEHPRNDFNGQIIYQALGAYYAENPQEIQAFCQTFQIDYLIIDPETYTDQYIAENGLFYEPYNQKLLTDISQYEQFILNDIPDEQKVFQNERDFVIPCNMIGL
ncbi:MAG: hypothetical protein AAF629_25120, partial [Chloroflexota bacterium]